MSDHSSEEREVRYYRITGWGRSRIEATSDEQAIEVSKAYDAKYPSAQRTQRIVKETKETIFEDRSAAPLGKPVGWRSLVSL